MISPFSIENMKEELARALNKADEDAKTIAELRQKIPEILEGMNQTEIESSIGWWETSTGAEFGETKLNAIMNLLTNNKPDMDFPLLLQDEAG